MLLPPFASPSRFGALTALLLGAVLVPSVFAAEPPAGTTPEPASQSAMVNLINRLVERGVLTKKDSAELLLLAEADAADARAQAAMTQAALAQAAAAQARAKAMAALAGLRLPAAPAADTTELDRAAAIAADTDRAVALARAKLEREPVAGATPNSVGIDSDALPAPTGPKHVTRAAPAAPAVEQSDEAEPAPVPVHARHVARAPAQPPADTAESNNEPAVARTRAEPASPSGNTVAETAAQDDTVRVTYVPETVKAQLREEVKQDVLDEARKEGWATPQAVPGWVSQIRLFGDVRMRYEGYYFPTGNDNTGAFPNFNAINTGAPFDTSGTIFSPQLNVDQKRTRLRLRARLGSEVDLGENFSIGLRVATGENNSPVTENQSLGAAGAGQGGNFAKYAVWLDRAFLNYEVGGQPDGDLNVTFGRFDNPFISTVMLWADDLGFDGLMSRGKVGLGEDITPFFVVGAFPVFNTDLNFATNAPAKFSSYDKWMYAGQLGSTFEFGKNISLKLGASYYLFRNIEGQLSMPFTPLTSSDAGNTDASRPAFAQKGNTYMALRDIVASPLNNNGTIDQFQYYGLASKFRELAFDARLDFNNFEPFQISLSGEYVKNLAFDPTAISTLAVNNRGASVTTSSGATPGAFLGGNTAWMAAVTVGDAALQKRWDWNVSVGYRKVASDALVDGFCDSDFGGGGTNLKGLTFSGSLALSPRVWMRLRWMSASELAGPVYKNDVLQMDLNGKF
jgi:hypothetical protein